MNGSSDAVKTITYNADGVVFNSYARYDDNHQPTKTMDYRGMVDTYAYDSFGNVTRHKTYHTDNTGKFLYTRASYDSTTGRQTYAHDPRINGVGTSYTYDDEADLLTQRIDPNGQVFQYAYDEDNDQQTTVTAIDVKCASGDIANNFAYDVGRLTQVTHNGYNFNYNYEKLGRNSRIKAGGNSLVYFTYTNGEESQIKSEYDNGFVTLVYFDSRGNPIKKRIDGTVVSTASYDELGNVKKLVDKLSNVCYTYTYNKEGKLTQVKLTNASSGSTLGTQTYSYDSKHRLTSSYDSRTGFTYCPIYEKSGSQYYPDNATKGIKLNGKYTDEVERDGLRRPATRKLTLGSASTPLMTDTYGYLVGYDNSTTNFVSSLTHTVGSSSTTYNYTYDNVGNIETVKRGGTNLVKYTYDGLNRLIQEDHYEFGKRYTYTYDNGGNITSKKEYTLTSSGSVTGSATTYAYTYDTTWKDKLTSFNGQTCAYDVLGNPTTYRGNALTWTQVRRLKKYGTNTFEYGADGIRTKKNSITYTLDGNKILKETDGSKTLIYYYGNSGVIGFKYNNVDYYYEKNLQGDVIAIYNASGTKVATYVYDAWGKVLSIKNASGTTITDSTHVGIINPFRYRSYYYDTETGLYYLQTRYYDPETGRFINSDALEYLGDGAELSNYNLFAYCGNNPVNDEDPEGTFVISLSALLIGALVGAGIGAAIGFGSTVYQDYKDDGEIFNGSVSVGDYVGATLGGGIAGAGTGMCTVLGGAVGTAMLLNTTATFAGISLTFGSAFAIGTSAAFTTGMIGYAVRAGFSSSEDFEIDEMLINGLFNGINGGLSVFGGCLGGMCGFRINLATNSVLTLTQKALRTYIENVFTVGIKIGLAFIKSALTN